MDRLIAAFQARLILEHLGYFAEIGEDPPTVWITSGKVSGPKGIFLRLGADDRAWEDVLWHFLVDAGIDAESVDAAFAAVLDA